MWTTDEWINQFTAFPSSSFPRLIDEWSGKLSAGPTIDAECAKNWRRLPTSREKIHFVKLCGRLLNSCKLRCHFIYDPQTFTPQPVCPVWLNLIINPKAKFGPVKVQKRTIRRFYVFFAPFHRVSFHLSGIKFNARTLSFLSGDDWALEIWYAGIWQRVFFSS